MWNLNFSGSKEKLEEAYEAAAKNVTTDQGAKELVWDLVEAYIDRPSIRNAQTVEVSATGGTVQSTGRDALSINLTII